MKRLSFVLLGLVASCFITRRARRRRFTTSIRHGRSTTAPAPPGEGRGRRHPRRSRRGRRRSQRRARTRRGRRDRARSRPASSTCSAIPDDLADRGRRSQGTLRQGVTLEVFGESSMGPINEQMKKDQMERCDIKFNIVWNTLGGYLDHLVARGISTNVASLRERGNGARERDRPGQPSADRRGARAHARPRAPRDGRGRDGPHHGAHLHSRRVCEDRRARRAGEGRISLRRDVHLAHAERGQSPAGGDRRNADHRARGEDPRGDLPPERERRVELEQARRRDRQGRRRAEGRPRHHRRHVHLHRRIDRSRRGDAALGAGRRLQGVGAAAAGSEDPRARPARDDDAERRVGEPDVRGGRKRHAAGRLQERSAAESTPARRSRMSRSCATSRSRTPRWTSSSKTAAASRSCIS